MSVEGIEARLDWWWRGENRSVRKAMENVHRTRCERGHGSLVNILTNQVVSARCKSWRECGYCAWVYGVSVERLFKPLKRLRAFVVFTMPSELGDWSNKSHIAEQAKAMRRLNERLFRRFGHRFLLLWMREHNTKTKGLGRLHLNVLWDEDWVEQSWLSETASACGFGDVVYISRIGARAETTRHYATKCLRYASKDLSDQTDWPKGTRRWGASRNARGPMKRPEKNPGWYWSPVEPPTLPLTPVQVLIRVGERPPYQHEPLCVCRTTFCKCGARDDLRGTQAAPS
jgi:hypothetical protein